METQLENLNPIKENIFRKIFLLGVMVFFIVLSVSMLHVNQPEFIGLRFPFLSDFEKSLFDTLLYAAYISVGLTVGVVSDRIGKRRIFVLIGSGGSILFFWLMTIATDYTVLLIFRFAQGGFTVLAWQILMTLALDISGKRNRGKNMGFFGIFLVLAMGIGTILGGVFAELGVFMPYYFSAIFNGVVFLISVLILKEPAIIKKNPSVRQILLVVKNHPKLVIPGIFNFIDRLHMGFIIFIVQFFLADILGLSEGFRGMILAIYSFPLLILSYHMGKLSDRVGRYKPLIVGSIGFGIVLSLIGNMGVLGLPAVIILFIILGSFASMTTPPAMALVGDVIKEESTATGMGFFNFLGNVGIFIGPSIAGLLMFNYSLAFLVAGLIELISLGVIGIILWIFRRKESIRPSKFCT